VVHDSSALGNSKLFNALKNILHSSCRSVQSFQAMDVSRCVRVPDHRCAFHIGMNCGFVDVALTLAKNNLTLVVLKIVCFTYSFQLRYWSTTTPKYIA